MKYAVLTLAIAIASLGFTLPSAVKAYADRIDVRITNPHEIRSLCR